MRCDKCSTSTEDIFHPYEQVHYLQERVQALEEALRPLTYSAAHNTCSGPSCIVCRARELLEGS